MILRVSETEVKMKTVELFQWFLIFLLLFWPVWALAFVFLRWLFIKATSFLGRLDLRKSAPFSNQGATKKHREVHDISPARYARVK